MTRKRLSMCEYEDWSLDLQYPYQSQAGMTSPPRPHTCNPITQKLRPEIPGTNWLARLAPLASSGFNDKTLP